MLFEKIGDVFEVMERFEKSGLGEMELCEGDRKLVLRKNAPAQVVSVAAQVPVAAAAAGNAKPESKAEPAEGVLVRSPLVGTFYAASAPGAAPFAEAGKRVSKGQALCIVEAMKVMNEIESPCDGVIAEVCVNPGALVEYDQVLFRIVELM